VRGEWVTCPHRRTASPEVIAHPLSSPAVGDDPTEVFGEETPDGRALQWLDTV
jgi:hypothetical protein